MGDNGLGHAQATREGTTKEGLAIAVTFF